GVFSYEFGYLKPENEIYLAAIERFRLNRFNRVIFVDDQPLNIVAAERLGWIGVQFTNACFVRQQIEQIIGSLSDVQPNA
ncbi:MAG: HAD-IA family hydrolase, partial [Burkholderiaceae bacterium]